MPKINISTTVYAEIWGLRQNGEETENDILSRLLDCEKEIDSENLRSEVKTGFYDGRHDVRLAEGFEIFRTYKGIEYRAKARANKWAKLETGEEFSSLNRLNKSLPGGSENAWRVWKYIGDSGKPLILATFRR